MSDTAFGKNCPWKGCQHKIVRGTGDTEGELFSARCEADHRSAATRKKGKVVLTPDTDGSSLDAVTETT